MRAGNGTLPTGLVTFVLTDIEGSTRLLRQLGEGYDEVQDLHVDLLRQSWEEHGGVHLSARGDSCLAAFGDAAAAVQSCADAQRRLAAGPWPADGRPRVRIGLHTGLATPRDGDYVALAVHQTARVTAAGHGGQVLVSDATAARSGVPPGLELRRMGRYRLRDFDDPVLLYSLAAPGLDADFPPVRAMPVDGHNLAIAPTSFVGRDADLSDVQARLRPGRLVTLSGPGGVGKSRLAAEVGQAVASQWDDGVWLVDIGPLHEARLIGSAVASVLGAAFGTETDRWQDSVAHLKKRRTLLVLDNCEQFAADLAELVGELLTSCPDVGVMATSREPLGIAGELVWRMSPLALPELGATVETVLSAPATRLFVERAQSALPTFAVDDANVQTVVRLCRRLDGLPLALELAAAQTAVARVGDLLEGLDDRFRVLRSRSRSVPDRQRTMDAVMDWSYRLLDPAEQAVFRRLGLFRNGFSVDAAVVAGGDVGDDDVTGALWSLIDKSLVVFDLTANETRYRLLETVSAYARRLLDAEGETEPTAMRLAAWWLERIGPWHRMDRVRSGEIEAELDNLRALVPLVGREAEEQAQRLVCSIGHHYYAVHAPRDGIAELSGYADELATPSRARVSLLATLAMLHVHHGDIDSARRVLAEAQDVQARAGGAPVWDEVAVERALGEVALRSGDHEGAADLAKRTLERDLTATARARMLNLLAIASYFRGDVGVAEAAFSGELDLARQLGDEHLMVMAEGNVAELALRRGDAATAALHQAACLDLALALGRPVAVAYSLIVAARLTASADPDRAASLHAKAEDLLDENGIRLYDDDLRASEEMLDRVRQDLGDLDFRVADERGRSLTLLDAAELATRAFATTGGQR